VRLRAQAPVTGAMIAGSTAAGSAFARPVGGPPPAVPAAVAPAAPAVVPPTTVVSDSVLAAVAPAIAARFPVVEIDAVPSRQPAGVLAALRTIAAAGRLGQVVVIGAGTNGAIAEAQLRAANAEVGVATANMLPQISLTANYGASAEALRNLFSAGSLLWGVGANVAQPLFDGGALLHRKRASEAQLEQALAQYRSTVLTAFQNVADALEAVRYDAEQRLAASRQESAAQSSLHMATRQLELGDVSRLVLLNSESSYLQATLMRIQVQASQFADVCAVYQSLGGSWNVAQTANR